jgi:glycosyltransferase involved in cell wall biosynthesis
VTDQKPLARDISIVIPTVGRDVLKGCLDTIRRGTVWPSELIVTDQSSNVSVDAWIDGLRRDGLRITHVRSRQRGIAAATNRGLERVRTPFVAVTHDDCRVRSDWLERISVRVGQVGDAILTGRVEPDGNGLVLEVVTHPDPVVYGNPMIDRDVLFPANMAFRMQLLARIGYLDEHPSLRLAGEDNDWAYRAFKAGISIVYDPEVVVGHLARHHPRQLTSLYLRYARGQGSFYGKHLRAGDPFIAKRVARDVVRAPWLLVRGVLTGNRQLLAMGLGEVRGLLPGLVAGFQNRGDRLPPPRAPTPRAS